MPLVIVDGQLTPGLTSSTQLVAGPLTQEYREYRGARLFRRLGWVSREIAQLVLRNEVAHNQERLRPQGPRSTPVPPLRGTLPGSRRREEFREPSPGGRLA
jgi:hypothetical protein